MPIPEIPDLTGSLEFDLGDEPTKEELLSAIDAELRELQMPQPDSAQHDRQIRLVQARGELLGHRKAGVPPSKDLVSVSPEAQMMEIYRESMTNKNQTTTMPRPDPMEAMRTTVKATATQASSDFTKARTVPFATASTLIVAVYGLRTFFNVGEMELPSEWFYPIFWGAAVFIIGGYIAVNLAQRKASRVLRSLYNPDVQESALNFIEEETSDYFGDHSQRMIEVSKNHGRSHRAVDDGNGFIISRGLYQDSLSDTAGNNSLVGFLSTIDLAAATEDATGLALDRLCELKIVEPVVYRRRHAFRLIPD